MKKLSKKQIRKNIKELKDEIQQYGIKKSIADAMITLTEKYGFEFSGHGCGFGGEDFSVTTEELHVNFCDCGRKVEVTIYKNDTEECEKLYKGAIGGAIKYVKKYCK